MYTVWLVFITITFISGKCIYDQEELKSISQNTSYVKSLYSCTFEKKFLKKPDNQCSAVNHTEKVPGIYINETACVEFESDSQIIAIKDQLFDIPFGIRKTGKSNFSINISKFSNFFTAIDAYKFNIDLLF